MVFSGWFLILSTQSFYRVFAIVIRIRFYSFVGTLHLYTLARYIITMLTDLGTINKVDSPNVLAIIDYPC